MYESAACLHGRRRVLNGPYYASVFAHYQPVEAAVWNFTIAVSRCTVLPLEFLVVCVLK